MATRLLRLLPVVAALALALTIAGSAEPSSLVAGALVAAAAVAVTIAVLAVRPRPHANAAGILRAHRTLPGGQPAPAHPGTPGRARPRAPGHGLLAASS